MCEFLTAVYYKLPIKALVYNNSAFGLIALEAEAIGVPAYYQALDFPNLDYVALARLRRGRIQGQKAGRVARCHRQGAEGRRSGHCRLRGSADELPNVPHIELEELGNFAKVKIRKQSAPRPAGDDGPIPSWFQRR